MNTLIRPIEEGILLINKPRGPSSFDVVRRVRKALGIKRIGHAGTLDPLASGLMVILLGRYTKLAGYLTDHSKVYEATFTLGISTTTDDSEGELTATKDISQLNEKAVKLALNTLVGPIMQVPPRHSAIRVNGERSYTRARAAEEFSLPPRPVEIFELAVIKIDFPHVYVRVHCSKGTYIRSLARDLGELLGVGAFASAIHRTHSGFYSLQNALSYEDINQETVSDALLQGKNALKGLYLIDVDFPTKRALLQGKIVSGISLRDDWAVACYEDDPVAIIKKENGGVKVARGI